MAETIVFVKERGSRPAAEGVLARFARVYEIGSPNDLDFLRKIRPDIVLVDLTMPHLNGNEVLAAVVRAAGQKALVICSGFTEQPRHLLPRLQRFLNARPSGDARRMSISQVASVLGASQEVLARILNVSSRTVHRWLKGARPRPRLELDKLTRVASLLQQTLPGPAAAREYLRHPNPNLSGEAPLNLLARGEFDRVAADLLAAQEGVYV